METVDLTIAGSVAGRFGLATRAGLIAAGLTVPQIDGRVEAGHLISVHSGVYRVPAVRPGYEQQVAACLATGGVASHRCAARLFGLRAFERHPQVEVTVEAARAPELPGVVMHRTKALERTTIGIIPVAVPGQVLLDLAAVAPRLAEGAVNDVLARRLASLPALVRFLQRRAAHGRDGTARLRELLAEQARAGAPTESWLEDRIVEFLRRYGFPEPVRQYWVRLPGRRVRCDFFWPGPRLDLEGDSRLFHTSPTERRRDGARDAALATVEVAVERLTWLHMEEAPAAAAARVWRWFHDDAAGAAAA